VRNHEHEAGVPVKDREEIVKQCDSADDIRVVSVPLRAVEERPEAVDLDQPEAAEDGAEADGEIEKV